VELLKKVMRRPYVHKCCLFFGLLAFSPLTAPSWAGPYRPAAGEEGSWAIHMDDAALVAWATDWQDYEPGPEVDAAFGDPGLAVGQASGNSFDIVALGRGGQITMIFDPPIQNGPGWDFAVFENSFSDTFLELAYVEASSNGVDFFQFDSDSLTPSAVPGFGAVDPTNVQGLAGKYRQAYGTPFDLADVGLATASHIRIVDIIGDGSCLDTTGHPIYDPYPTFGSAGFDLDAIGVSNGAPYPAGNVTTISDPGPDGEAGFGGGGGCFIGGCL
jgi:hypothetical protein